MTHITSKAIVQPILWRQWLFTVCVSTNICGAICSPAPTCSTCWLCWFVGLGDPAACQRRIEPSAVISFCTNTCLRPSLPSKSWTEGDVPLFFPVHAAALSLQHKKQSLGTHYGKLQCFPGGKRRVRDSGSDNHMWVNFPDNSKPQSSLMFMTAT